MNPTCRQWIALADRTALGEPVELDDKDWFERHATHCSRCGNEMEFYQALGGVLNSPDRLDTRIDTSTDRRSTGKLTSPRGIWMVAAAAMALGSAIALGHNFANRTGLPPPAPSEPVVRFASVDGNVQLGNRDVHAGDPWNSADSLRVARGQACLSLDKSVRCCLDGDSEASLVSLSPSLFSIHLKRGRIVSRLQKQPATRRFAIQAATTTVTAKGTAFVVSVDTEQRVSVHLYEGALEIRSADGPVQQLTAPAAAVIEQSLTRLPLSERLRAADAHLLEGSLGTTNHSRASETTAIALDAEPTVRKATSTPTTELGATKWSSASPSSKSAEGKAGVVSGSARALLAEAQSLRANGRLRRSAATFRQLVKQFPSSSEARVSLVSLGELDLTALGQPQLALRSFDSYLEQPGALAREARFGRIRALRALSRQAEADAAVADFLRLYPNSVQSERLRARGATK